ncbi:MAG: hypothetical protein JW716_00835 [Candidatus Aenigmarchaeota archaeon]|nr:hypothetical protein [Candidatus Aenigmarchaeota archaeon]
MDEFIYVLIAVVVIFALLFAFSAPLADIMSDDGSTGNEVEIANLSVGSVGLLGNNIAKVVSFGTFDLGTPQKYDFVTLQETGIQGGVMGSHSERFDIDTTVEEVRTSLKSVKVGFDLKKTNQLGNLVINWNGYEIFNDVANLNHYDIEIPSERIMEKNYIEISAAPSWMFWTATSYELENLKVYAEYGPEKVVPFVLTTEEIETWDKGEFSFFTTGDDETSILIKLNGDVVYNDNNIGERAEFEIGYTDADLKAGTNLMSFKATGGIITMHNTKMNVITFEGGSARVDKNINIPQDKYAYLSRYGASLDIYITEIDKQGTLIVAVNGKEISSPVSVEGHTTMFIDATKFVQGDNVISFSGTGVWNIESVRIYTKK